MDTENTPLNNDSEENSPVNVVPRLTMMTSPSTLEAARRPLSLDEELSEETNGESSLNEEQISEVDEAELNPTDEESQSESEDDDHDSQSESEDDDHDSQSESEDDYHDSQSESEFLNECGEVDEDIRALRR